MENNNWTNVFHSRLTEGAGNNPGLPEEVIVDQLGDEVFGIPPSLLTGLLTGLAGTVAGGVSLPIFFYLWEPDYYISPEWLVFVAVGGLVGFFLRLEQPLFREIYHLKTQALLQAQDNGKRNRLQDCLAKAGFRDR